MVSSTEVGGDNTPNSQAAKKNQPRPNNKKSNGFKGDAKTESALNGKVIISGSSQAGQLISLTESLSSFIGDKGFPHWAESIRLMQRSTEGDFMPANVGRSAYGAIVADVFVWNGNALDTEDEYIRAMKIWEKNVTAGINQWNKYKDNGESIFLAIQGQVEPSLWDKTKDDARFPAIQALKCPIALINLMKERCTGGTAGTWEPLAFIKQLDKTISYSQCPPRGGNSMTIGEYKRTVESYVSTTCKLGGLLAFGSTLMEPILAAPQPGATTLLAYVGMTEVLR